MDAAENKTLGTLDEIELQALARADDYDVFRVLVRLIRAEADLTERKFEARPMLCDGDWRQDARFLAGRRNGLKWVLSLREQARELVSKR